MPVSHDALARRLRDAYRTGPVPPLRDGLDVTDLNGAYAVQATNTRIWVEQGRRIVGRKIGLTARAVQAQLGVDRPDFGVLFDDMAVDDGGAFATSALQPKVEAEVALVMARDLEDPRATVQQVTAAAAYAVPAIEIVDSRIADWKITFADTVSRPSSARGGLARENTGGTRRATACRRRRADGRPGPDGRDHARHGGAREHRRPGQLRIRLRR